MGDDVVSDRVDFERYLASCRSLVIEHLRAMVAARRRAQRLYARMLEYPLREAKALRPALCLATCRALGGRVEQALPTATALELYHNAFLVHDDVEDGSLMRRGGPALQHMFGVPIAVNVGDAMLAASLDPLLNNVEHLGLGRALRILRVVSRMARESAEGQAVELDWIRDDTWDLTPRDYRRLVYQKTCWYTFVAPMLCGAIAASHDVDDARLWAIERFAIEVGVAFQIHDDVLNLTAPDGAYGKEAHGDLWEGKRTLMVLDAVARSTPDEAAEFRRRFAIPRAEKTDGDVRFLSAFLTERGSVARAAELASRWAGRAERSLRAMPWMRPSLHRDVLVFLCRYVTERTR